MKINSFFNILFNNKYFSIILTLITIIICTYWFSQKTRFAYYSFYDILDYILYPYSFSHGRILSELIAVFFIKELPLLLGININDFTFFSKGIIPTINQIAIALLLANTLFRTKKVNLLYPFAFIFCFFNSFFIIRYNHNIFFEVFAFFVAYIFPLPFFIVFWNKISTLYINKEMAIKKDYTFLFLITLFLMQANEMMLISNILILGFIVIEYLFKKFYKKEKSNYIWSVPLFLYSICIGLFIHSTDGSRQTQAIYNHFDTELLSISNFLSYLKHFIIEIYGDNIIFLTTIALSLLIIFSEKNKTNAKKILNIVLYTITSFSLFFIGMYFAGDSCHYANAIEDNIPSWWFLYFSLQVQWEIILLLIIVFLFGVIISLKEKRLHFIILVILFFTAVFTVMKEKQYIFIEDFYLRKNLQNLYKMDKMALFAVKNKKYIVLPAEYMENYYTMEEGIEVMPIELKRKTYKTNKIYFYDEIEKKSKWPYLKYLEEVYDVKVKKGMIFMPEEMAIENFYKQKGSFTAEEIKNPEFEELEEIVE